MLIQEDITVVFIVFMGGQRDISEQHICFYLVTDTLQIISKCASYGSYRTDLQYLSARPEKFIFNLQDQIVAVQSVRIKVGNALYFVVRAELLRLENGLGDFVFSQL